jgi:dolichol-phosphate mannosyltransferase
MKLAVIAPTFNEADNVVPLIDAVEKALGCMDYELLFVDDDSQDLTWQRVEEIAAHNPRVRVLRRHPPRGLALSVIDGFLDTQADIVACIDADLQHDPAILPTMLATLESGSDLVIGSRYVAEGKLENWSRIRQAESWIATTLAKLCLGIEVSDPMSGYFMMRRKDFLRTRQELDVQGFKILLEILVALQPRDVVETPYTFRPRVAGKSKLNAGIALAYLVQLFRLGWQRVRRANRSSKFPAVDEIRDGMKVVTSTATSAQVQPIRQEPVADSGLRRRHG